MSFASEFGEFAVKGNVMDLAVGVIIGAAFGKIVDSVVNDLIMPLVGKATGGLDFSNYFIPLAGQTATNLADAKKAGAALGYGTFITMTVNFIIIAWVMFLVVKGMNTLFAKEQDSPPPPKPPSKEEELLAEIRDLLKARA